MGLPHTALPEQIRDAVQSWLQRQARRIFQERVEHFAERLGVRCTRLALSSAQTRWGSASADGSVRLNWRLVHFALPTIDYVVTHELAHLREMNHSPRFWDVVRSVLPDYERMRGQLKDDVLPPSSEADSTAAGLNLGPAAPSKRLRAAFARRSDGDDGCGDARVGQPGVVAARDLADGGGRGRAILPVLPGTLLVLAGVFVGAWIDGFTRVSAGRSASSPCWPCSPGPPTTWPPCSARRRPAPARRRWPRGHRHAAGIFTGFVGLLFMPLLGAMAGEYWHRSARNGGFVHAGEHVLASRQAARVGVATWLGQLIGTVVKVVLIFLMIGVFAVAYWV